MTSPEPENDLDRAEHQVFDEQESNARATGDSGPRDDDQADELADEAATEEFGDS